MITTPDSANEGLYLIDAIGPFFRHCDRKRINWSKIPFRDLERDGRVDRDKLRELRGDFDRFCQRAAAAGANAISLDDLAHLVVDPDYSDDVRDRIETYRTEFGALFRIAADHGLRVYLTADVFTTTARVHDRIGRDHDAAIAWLRQAMGELFDRYPELDGFILRIGECDGLDVEDEIHSRLLVRTPKEMRRYLRGLLPEFERRGKRLVFRTWTVGAYPIGDLIWHRSTFRRTLADIDSPALVLSMKYGETDFFRFLPLNGHFFRSRHQKIIELQTRREYEGCGEYPSFVGFDYEQYARALTDAPGVIGCMVWCQTGGWMRFRRLTWLDDSAIWNEINTFVTLQVFRHGRSVERAVADWWHERGGAAERGNDLLELLRLSDEVIKELLYIEPFARQKLFFRRTRIPPLLTVYWDRVLVNHAVRKVLRLFVTDPEATLRQGQAALHKIETMRSLAELLGLPTADFDFQLDTFRILAKARRYYFEPFDATVAEELESMKADYKRRYAKRRRYAFKLNFSRLGVRRARLRWIFALALRRQRGYRMVDRVFALRLLGLGYPILRRAQSRFMPKYLRNQAMGFDSVLK